ncbi:MAG: glucuronate isomerase [Bacteroidota bacterium]
MKDFLDQRFLLNSETAVKLYRDFSKDQPVLDYHCHLNPKDIAEDRKFNNISEAWLHGDHYKWRAMRSNGIDEKYITGNAGDEEKFLKWAETVPYTLRNPLYHWTHLELQRYFGIGKLLQPSSASEIYHECTAKLREKEFSVRNLLLRMNVDLVCTTDDPVDTLEYHEKIANDGFAVRVIPAWRPDKAMAVENVISYNHYLDKLSGVSGIDIARYDDLLDALQKRQNYFHEHGCRLSDHGLEMFYIDYSPENEIRSIFANIRQGHPLDEIDILKFKSAMLYQFAVMDHEKNWVQQFHVGALRNNNSRMLARTGPDSGFDSIADFPVAVSMSKFFDRLCREDKLAKTIIYNLNPSDNEVFASMIGNFQQGNLPGKIQWGAAWWFLDQKTGIEKHLDALSSLGLLSRFVGMLTDSRSFLSFPRHEYFRRILCNLIGNEIEKGEIPYEMDLIGPMISDISYRNARNYFSF